MHKQEQNENVHIRNGYLINHSTFVRYVIKLLKLGSGDRRQGDDGHNNYCLGNSNINLFLVFIFIISFLIVYGCLFFLEVLDLKMYIY